MQTLALEKADEAEALCSLHLAAQSMSKNEITTRFHMTKKWKEITLLYEQIEKGEPFKFDLLKESYEEVLKKISFNSTNWVRANLKDLSAISYMFSEEDYVLFIKTSHPIFKKEIF